MQPQSQLCRAEPAASRRVVTSMPGSADGFRSAYPDYAGTGRLDELRAAEYGFLDAGAHVYLDFTGAGLPSDAQLRAHVTRIRGGCFGNPHSENPTSSASTGLVEQARAAVLQYFRASPQEYAVIFTPNATGACRLVGEAYPFGPGSRLVLTVDNHNSVNGIREFARSRHGAVHYLPLEPVELRAAEPALRVAFGEAGQRGMPGRRGLLAFPAQSNFTGVQHPLGWVDVAHQHGYDVLLDAAAFIPTNRLDLGAARPDFVAVSWYKVFGFPTGVGCLVARRDALARLRRPWFSGGTIKAASALAGWHVLAGDESAFEDGTLNFLTIPDVAVGLDWIERIGLDVIHQRVTCLTGWLIDRLTGLRHSNGRPMIRLYGPASAQRRGGTVAFNVLDPTGRVVDVRAVSRDASRHRISLRTGCFCNPGAAEAAFSLPRQALRSAPLNGTVEDYLAQLGLPSGGAIRASLGLVSTLQDVEHLLQFVADTYHDRLPDLAEPPPLR